MQKPPTPRPPPAGLFHTPNRGPRIRITRDDMENFKVGDTVQWASSANGFWKEKKGIVESVIPAGGNPQIYATRVAEKYGRKAPHLGYPRDHVSYIVRVPSKNWWRRKVLPTPMSHYLKRWTNDARHLAILDRSSFLDCCMLSNCSFPYILSCAGNIFNISRDMGLVLYTTILQRGGSYKQIQKTMPLS